MAGLMDELGKAVSKLSDLGGKAVEGAKDLFEKAKPGIEDTFEGMLRAGEIKCIDDNDLLKIHMMDAAQQIETGTSAHPRKKLVKLSKNAHVDGVAAILDALCMRQNHWAEMGKRLMNAG